MPDEPNDPDVPTGDVPPMGERLPKNRDTPAARRARDEALGLETDPDEDVVIVAAAGTVPYGRRRRPGETNALVASAARIDLKDRRSIADLRRRRQAWQSEAWDYFDEVGEIGGTVDFVGNLLSKVRLFAATRPDPNASPVPVDSEESGIDPSTAKLCNETLARLASPEGGQSALIREMTINFEVAGECYLHGHEDPDTGEEDWQIRSVDELAVIGDQFALRSAPGSTALTGVPADDLVARLWIRHPRFSQLATCAMRRVLAEAEALLLLSREIRSTAKSRLGAGILKVPDELSFGSADPTRDLSDGESTEDPFDRDLREAMITPIQEEGSAGAVVPIVIRGPLEYLKGLEHIDLSKGLDEVLDKRIEGRVLRIARGLSMPVETTTGLMATTFANAAVVKKSEWDSYGEPRAVTIVDAITAAYFQPSLEESSLPREKVREIFVWFDPTECIAAPDPTDTAEKDHEDGILSDEARRRLHGHSEEDAPTDIEVLRRAILKSGIRDPFVIAQLLIITGLAPDIDVPAPLNGILGETELPTPDLVTAIAAALPRGSSRGHALGRRLMAIDRDLRTRLQIAANDHLNRALDRAGARIRSKAGRSAEGDASSIRRVIADAHPRNVAALLGPNLVAALGLTDDELLSRAFEEYGAQFASWTAQAQQQALAVIQDAYGALEQRILDSLAVEQATRLESAWAVLRSGLERLAQDRLYNPTPGAPGPGENDPTVNVPVGIIRQAMAIAGGTPAESIDGTVATDSGEPTTGVATGPDLLDAADLEIEAYEWDYGQAPRIEFEPHRFLDGEIVTDFDDDRLANDEGWPEVDFYFPGDHAGCVCDWALVLVPASDVAAPSEETAPPEEVAPE